MDIEKQKNFVIPEKIPESPFFRDDAGKVSLHLKVSLEEVKSLIDGAVSLGAAKSDKKTIRFSAAVDLAGSPAFVTDITADINENRELINDFIAGKKQYVSFFYELDNTDYYGLSKSLTLVPELLSAVKEMLDQNYPVIRKIKLFDTDLISLSGGRLFKYVFKTQTDLSVPIMEQLISDFKEGQNSVFWWGLDNGTPFIVTDHAEMAGSKPGTLCDPLRSGAIPYGAVSSGIIYLIVTDKEGFKRLSESGNADLYEKNYSFWN